MTQPSGDVVYVIVEQGPAGAQGEPGGPEGPQGPPGPSGKDARRPQRNTIAAVGDSITSADEYYGYQPALGHSYLQQLQLLTHQRIRFGAGNFGVAGSQIAHAQSTQLPQVLAMDPPPGACVLAVGTNDVKLTNPAGFVSAFSTMVSTLTSMVADLLDAGIMPILWCVPPNARDTSPTVPAAAFQPNIHKWNMWVRRYAATNGYALIDAHTALATADGTYLSGAGADDLIHPSAKGQRLIAQRALADGLATIFPPNSLVNTARQTDDLSNLFNNGTLNLGLFTSDTNSDGIADGMTKTGAATPSLVEPDDADHLYGQWQQISAVTGQTGSLIANITTGWSVGDRLAFSARVQTEGFEASGASWLVSVLTDTPGGYVTPTGTNVTGLWNGTDQWLSDVEDGEIYSEFTILTAMTTVKLAIFIWIAPTSGSAVLRVGEATIRNLTTEGVA